MPAPLVFANVAFLRIARFDERSVVEQAGLKDRLEELVRRASAGMPAADRIVLDATDGIALVLFGEPAAALEMAQSLRAGTDGEALKVGLNHGPLAVTARGTGGMVFGDGLASAAAAAGFAGAGHLLVTAPFAKMLEATRPDSAAQLVPAGEFTDARVRLHSFYTPDPQRLVARRNRLSAYALAGILAILLFGVAGREVNRRFFPPRPATIEFDVRPRGDVIIDGILSGHIPALREIEVPPGRHEIVVRNGRLPPVDLKVNLEPGERMTISHTFAGAPPASKPGSFWRDLRRRFGI